MAFSLIPLVVFFIKPKWIISIINKFSESGFKCPNCRNSMLWKKNYPFGQGIPSYYDGKRHENPAQVEEYYFYCPKCNNKYKEKRALQNGIYKSIDF